MQTYFCLKSFKTGKYFYTTIAQEQENEQYPHIIFKDLNSLYILMPSLIKYTRHMQIPIF